MVMVHIWRKIVPLLLVILASLLVACPDEGGANSCLTGYYTDPDHIDPNACIICQTGTPGYEAYEKAKNSQIAGGNGGNTSDAFGFDTVVAALTSSESEYTTTTGALDNPDVSTGCNPTCGPGFYCCQLGIGPMCVSGSCLNSSGGCRGNNISTGGSNNGGNVGGTDTSTGGADTTVSEETDITAPSGS